MLADDELRKFILHAIELLKPRGVYLDKTVESKHLSASGIVADKPCWIYAVIGSASSDAYSQWDIYNGENTSAKAMMKLKQVQHQPAVVVFKQPQYFDRGCYINFTTGGDFIFVQYKLDDETSKR